MSATITPIRGGQVIPFPTPEPTIRRQTVNDLFTTGPLPKRGDFIFGVTFQDDEEKGRVHVTVPGSGRVREVIINTTARSITLTFDFGMTATITGDASIRWYPDPQEKK